MRAILLAATLVGLAVGTPGAARADAPTPAPPPTDTSDPTFRAYLAKLPVLLERYSTNRKIRYRLTRYATDAKAGVAVGDVTVAALAEVVTDGQQIKVVALESKPERFKDVVQFWRPDMRFDVTKQGDKYKITQQELASGNYFNHEREKYNFCAHEPMPDGVSAGTTLWFDERGRDTGSVAVTAVESKPATRDGRAGIEVRARWDNRHGMVRYASTFLDPANDFMTVATETDWAPDPVRGENRFVREIEYQASADGSLVPKRSRSYFQCKSGAVVKQTDVEFLSYERYVPSAGEFLLEKDYGLVTPAAIPTLASAALAPRPPPPVAVGRGRRRGRAGRRRPGPVPPVPPRHGRRGRGVARRTGHQVAGRISGIPRLGPPARG